MANKRKNGEGGGTSFLVAFNPDVPEEAKALRVAKDKAVPHGQRKQLIIAFFNAIDAYERATGKEFTVATIASMFMTMRQQGRPIESTPVKKRDDVIVESAVKESDPNKIAQNFLKNRKKLW